MRSLNKTDRNATKRLSKILNYDPIRSEPVLVETFQDLVTEIAELSYLNKDYLLFFRGQCENFKNRNNSITIYPSIYRGEYVKKQDIEYKLNILNISSKLLLDELKKHQIVEAITEITRKKLLQWSILQHYEVCDTPLLDVTQSINVACSFASIQSGDNEFGYVYIFALPYITNRISINSEHDLLNIRLLSICPPSAYRPYF